MLRDVHCKASNNQIIKMGGFTQSREPVACQCSECAPRLNDTVMQQGLDQYESDDLLDKI